MFAGEEPQGEVGLGQKGSDHVVCVLENPQQQVGGCVQGWQSACEAERSSISLPSM